MFQLRVTEIYESLQGEGLRAGLPCIFIRLTGCDLRCRWCDSSFAFEGGEMLDERTIIHRIKKFDTRRVEFTGGEPMLQTQAMVLLMEQLLSQGYEVLIETGGHRDIALLPKSVIKIMDMKCPGSGESEKNLYSNLNLLSSGDEIKFVITDKRDFEWACAQIKTHHLAHRCHLLFAPVWGVQQASELAEWLLASGLDARLQLPLHKVLWGEARGR